MDKNNIDSNLDKDLKKSRKSLWTIIIFVCAALAAALIFLLFQINSVISDPIVKFVSASQRTLTAYSADIDADIENTRTNTTSKITGSYKINPEEKTAFATFNITSVKAAEKSSDNPPKNITLSCTGDGGTLICTNGDESSEFNISSASANQFFSLFSELDRMDSEYIKYDWDNAINNIGLSENINGDEVGKALNAIYNALSSDEERRLSLGITEKISDNGEHLISFELNPYRTSKIILDNAKPIFKVEENYQQLSNSLESKKTWLNNLVIKFDVTISADGFISKITANNLGININISITNINSKKVETSIKNVH